MKEVLLNGTMIKNINNFHREISRALMFPDFYGNNLDALWDIFSGHIDTDIILIWENHETFKSASPHEFEQVLSIFRDLAEENSEFKINLK